jgi:hypothetical protein
VINTGVLSHGKSLEVVRFGVIKKHVLMLERQRARERETGRARDGCPLMESLFKYNHGIMESLFKYKGRRRISFVFNEHDV